MKPDGSLLCWQQPAASPCLEPDEFTELCLLLISLKAKFWFVSIIPKYVNFAKF
jgi:hypothetical protein